jgi:trehalose-6-phosphate synthase
MGVLKLTKAMKDRLFSYYYDNCFRDIANQKPIHLDKLPGNNVIVVATRAPKSPLSGGMAPAVKEACAAFDTKFWYAFGPEEKPLTAVKRTALGAFNGYHKKTVRIDALTVEGFRVRQILPRQRVFDLQQNEFCNRFLWPLCHNLRKFINKDVKKDDFSANWSANAIIAQRIVEDLGNDTTTPIWIHDYHHIGLAKELRLLGVKNPITYFHHIPLPELETLNNQHGEDTKLNEKERWLFVDAMESLKYCNAIFFQTEEVVKRYYKIIGEKPPESIAAYEGHFINSPYNDSGKVFVGHTPISINTEKVMKISEDVEMKTERGKELATQLTGKYVFINFERCDYSKGIRERVKAFQELLEKRPELKGQAQLVLGAEPTRGSIREYQEYADDVKRVVDEINKDEGTRCGDNPAIIFVNHNIPNEDVIRHMRNESPKDELKRIIRKLPHKIQQVDGQKIIGLVTPYEDGMNLTAKEFAASQDPENASPLVLSSGAGAAAELNLNGEGALVYPKIQNGDVSALVDAMEKAIDMPQEEANRRAVNMQNHLKEFSIQKWANFHKSIFERIKRGTFFPKPGNDNAPRLEVA